MPDPSQPGVSSPRSHTLRTHRFTLPNRIYHIAKRLSPEIAVSTDLTQAGRGEVIVNALIHQRDKAGCRLFAFVVMPDHVHWLFALPEGGDLSGRVKVAFNWCAVQLNKGLGRGGRVWQDGYYDHLVREGETMTGLIRYIEDNPVRKKLCAEAAQWQWSSANPVLVNSLDRDWLHHSRFE